MSRIRPPAEYDAFLNKLRDDDGVFRTRQKAMMFAAALGYCVSPEAPVAAIARPGEGIPLTVFENAGDDAFIDALAVSVDDTLKVLSEDQRDRRLQIFEHFASIGLARMHAQVSRPGGDALAGIIELLDHYSMGEGASTNSDIEDSIKKLAQFL